MPGATRNLANAGNKCCQSWLSRRQHIGETRGMDVGHYSLVVVFGVLYHSARAGMKCF